MTLCVLASWVALAQAGVSKIDAFDAAHADIALMQSKPIQREMGITEAQRGRMNGFADAHRNRLKAYAAKLKAQGKDPRSVSRTDPMIISSFKALQGGILGVLSPKQVTRLRQLTLQRMGTGAAIETGVAARLGITASSLKKMRAVYAEGGSKIQGIERGITAPIMAKYKDVKPKSQAEADRLQSSVRSELDAVSRKARPRLDAISADMSARILGMMSASQRKAFHELVGAPYKPSRR